MLFCGGGSPLFHAAELEAGGPVLEREACWRSGGAPYSLALSSSRDVANEDCRFSAGDVLVFWVLRG